MNESEKQVFLNILKDLNSRILTLEKRLDAIDQSKTVKNSSAFNETLLSERIISYVRNYFNEFEEPIGLRKVAQVFAKTIRKNFNCSVDQYLATYLSASLEIIPTKDGPRLVAPKASLTALSTMKLKGKVEAEVAELNLVDEDETLSPEEEAELQRLYDETAPQLNEPES